MLLIRDSAVLTCAEVPVNVKGVLSEPAGEVCKGSKRGIVRGIGVSKVLLVLCIEDSKSLGHYSLRLCGLNHNAVLILYECSDTSVGINGNSDSCKTNVGKGADIVASLCGVSYAVVKVEVNYVIRDPEEEGVVRGLRHLLTIVANGEATNASLSVSEVELTGGNYGVSVGLTDLELEGDSVLNGITIAEAELISGLGIVELNGGLTGSREKKNKVVGV